MRVECGCWPPGGARWKRRGRGEPKRIFRNLDAPRAAIRPRFSLPPASTSAVVGPTDVLGGPVPLEHPPCRILRDSFYLAGRNGEEGETNARPKKKLMKSNTWPTPG